MLKERWVALTPDQQEGFAPLCPDAVFEFASKHDWQDIVRAKMRTYIDNGARLAVLIDPERRVVEIYTPHDHPKVVERAPTVALDPVLAGFTLDLTQIFA
jgi:Uma2 family endonuclease